jgi:hypothetical protein
MYKFILFAFIIGKKTDTNFVAHKEVVALMNRHGEQK